MENQVLDSHLQVEDINQSQWAGFWIRVGASLIDALVFLPVIGFNFYNLYALKSLPLALIVTFALILYKPYMEFRYGATLGKMAVKIKVVNNLLNPITLNQAIFRYIPWLISQIVSVAATVLLYSHPDFEVATSMSDIGYLQNEVISPAINMFASLFLMVSCLVVAFSAKKQGLHDMMAGTFCVYK